MRTLFYLSDSAWSGCARFLLAAATELRARGVETTIACCADTRLAAWSAESGIDVVEINGKASTPGGAWDLRPILNERGVEVVMVTTQRDQLLTSSAKLFGGRIPVLRRVPPFGRVELTRGGKLALRMAAAGLIFTTEKVCQPFSRVTVNIRSYSQSFIFLDESFQLAWDAGFH